VTFKMKGQLVNLSFQQTFCPTLNLIYFTLAEVPGVARDQM